MQQEMQAQQGLEQQLLQLGSQRQRLHSPQQVQQETQQPQRLQPGGCRHKGLRYEAGERWATPAAQGCAEYECGEDGAVTTTRCGRIIAGSTCRVVRGDPQLPYPLCCPHVRCP